MLLSHSHAFGILRNQDCRGEVPERGTLHCALSQAHVQERSFNTSAQVYSQREKPLLDGGFMKALTVSSASFSSCWI